MPTEVDDKPKGIFHDLQDEEVYVYNWKDENFFRERGVAPGVYGSAVQYPLDIVGFGWTPTSVEERGPKLHLEDICLLAWSIEFFFPTFLKGYVDFDLEFFQATDHDGGVNEELTEVIQHYQAVSVNPRRRTSEELPPEGHPVYERLDDWTELHFRVVLK